MENINHLDVLYRGIKVGTLGLVPDNPYTYFSYDAEWLKSGFSISPFHLPLKEGLFRADKPYLFGLFGPFYDCLPDSWGNRVIDSYLHRKGIPAKEISILTRLFLLNDSSLGGLRFDPSQGEKTELGDMDIVSLRKEIDAILFDEKLDEQDLKQIYARASSTGGSRPKVNAIIDGKAWIIKFPSRDDKETIGQMEFDYMEAAEECGLNVPAHRLISDSDGHRYFACERFDRDENGNGIHRLSLAGLLETNNAFPQVDYITFLQVTAKLCPQDLEEAFRLMCFNAFAGNFDDHSENFSFIYDERDKQYRLSPCYDLTTQEGQSVHQLGFGRQGTPTYDTFLAMADKVSLPKYRAKQIIEKVKEVVTHRLAKYYDFFALDGRDFYR
ncbi:MAG: type II toxin-antitoxin system HipA family toxin [Erysipelotrichaceae bacterium]|nr:type II toxin-antitoxin system HipA family toxin [Erysipelotrichaceae bacterium]